MLTGLSVASLLLGSAGAGAAQDVIKIGMSMPLTGAAFNAVGRQVLAGARLYMTQHCGTVAGKRID